MLVAALLNRSACAAATSCTLALDWLEALMPCADLIAGKQQSFSLWQFNSLDILQKSKFIIPNLCKFFAFYLVHYCDVVCWRVTQHKYQEGNVRRGEGF